MLYRAADPSMLIPDQSQVGWTDLTRVFADETPDPSGVGAVQTASAALGISPASAAALVSSTSASTISVTQLAAASTQTRSRLTVRGANATRVPISPNVVTQTALISGDSARTFLLIQNNNAAGGASLLWSIDGAINTAAPWQYVNLAPGLGILLDEEVFTNPIYVAWGSGTVTGGVILFGSGAAAGAAATAGGGAGYGGTVLP